MNGKTVTVTDTHGRETRLAADKAVISGEGSLTVSIRDNGAIAAEYAAGQWVSAVHDEHRADDATQAPDGTVRALGEARRGLREILAAAADDAPFGRVEIRAIARRALDAADPDADL